MMRDTATRCAFVSTNSICQGEQVGVLWGWMLDQGMRLFFAHRTFQWSNEARGKAAVHCVIVGFAAQDITPKWLFEYEQGKGEPQRIAARNINPYLVDGPNMVVLSRRTPLCQVPCMIKGNEATDGGHLILNAEEVATLVEKEPQTSLWMRPFLGGEDFLNGGKRWCLWLIDITPDVLISMPTVLKQLEKTKQFRMASPKAATVAKAKTPFLFGEIRQPKTGSMIVIPKVSSERRYYAPLGFVGSSVILNNTLQFIPNGTLYEFGIIQSTMHMAWMRTICGRMKSDYQYSIKIVYNNFPWPEQPSDKQREAIEAAAQAVLDARSRFPESSLADLYDPLTMPPALLTAHQQLDRAVDAAYGRQTFASEAQRVAFLFALHARLTAAPPT